VNTTRANLIQQQVALITAEISFLNQLTAFRLVLGKTTTDWNLTIRY